MITLFGNYFKHDNDGRHQELITCLGRNLSHPLIDRLVLIRQPEVKQESFAHPKITWVELDCSKFRYNRPRFQDYFQVSNRFCTDPHDISIIANSDIYFDDTLRLLIQANLEGVALGLSRWDGKMTTDGQDTWIFQGRIRPIQQAHFPMGISSCDWRIAYLIRKAGYKLCNPCCSLHTHHLHTNHRNTINHGRKIPGPYERLTPSTWEDCHLPKHFNEYGLISFSLYGKDPKYCQGAIENAKLAKHVYPGWITRYYIDDSVPREVIEALDRLDVELVSMPRSKGEFGKFWRFLVADDNSVARWIVRDVDSRLNYRERRAVDAWIKSGLPFHIIRDHPGHRQPIMGCALGGIRGAINGMTAAVEPWQHRNDEAFLAEVVWPLIKDRTLVHDSFSTKPRFGEIHLQPFPTEREFGRFVGEVFDKDEQHNIIHRTEILQ